MSVLMIRLGGLGDLLVVLPSMACLRRALPGSRLELLCRGEYGGLFLDAGIADRIIPLEGREASSLFGKAGESATAPARDFSRAVGWMQKPSPSAIEASLRFLGIPAVFFRPPEPPSSGPFSRHFFAETVAAFSDPDGAVPDFGECSRLRSKRGGMTAARALLGNVISGGGRFAVIHPGSGGAAKLWPFDNFLEIAYRLRGVGIPGVFITGEAEECPAIAGRLERESLPSGWTWERKPPLLGVAGLLAEAPLYLGNDSGITHLAAACGARVTALFQERNIPAWEPFGRTLVIPARDLSGLEVDAVWASLRANGGIYHS